MRFLPLSQLGCQRDKQAFLEFLEFLSKLAKRCHNQAKKGLRKAQSNRS
jgi:hypothetical protein